MFEKPLAAGPPAVEHTIFSTLRARSLFDGSRLLDGFVDLLQFRQLVFHFVYQEHSMKALMNSAATCGTIALP